MDLSQALLLLAIVLALLLAVSPGGEHTPNMQQDENEQMDTDAGMPQLYHILIDRDKIPVLRVGDRWKPHHNSTFRSCYKVWSGAMKDGVFTRITIIEVHPKHVVLQIDNRGNGNCLLESMLLYMCAQGRVPAEMKDTAVLRMQLLDKLADFAKQNDPTGTYLQGQMQALRKESFTRDTDSIEAMLKKDYSTTFDQLGYERYLHIRRQNKLYLSELEIAAFTNIYGIVVRVYQEGESGGWVTVYPRPPQSVADNDPVALNPGADEVWNADGSPMEFNVSHLNLGHVGPPGQQPNHYVLLAAAEPVSSAEPK
jgi:hypothetical protein